jgi:hypothetical protein
MDKYQKEEKATKRVHKIAPKISKKFKQITKKIEPKKKIEKAKIVKDGLTSHIGKKSISKNAHEISTNKRSIKEKVTRGYFAKTRITPNGYKTT